TWDPALNLQYNSANASQVLYQSAASLGRNAGTLFRMDAPDEIFVLCAVSGGAIDWNGGVVIESGILRVDCSGNSNQFVLARHDANGTLNIGRGEEKGRLEIYRPDHVFLSGAVIGVRENGEFAVVDCAGGVTIETGIQLEKNGVMEISSRDYVSPMDTTGWDKDNFQVRDNALLNVFVLGDYNVATVVSDAGRAFIFASTLHLNQQCTLTLDAGDGEIFVGGSASMLVDIAEPAVTGAGGFNFMTTSGRNNGVFILSAQVKGIQVNTVSAAQVLMLWGMLKINGVSQNSLSPFNIDVTSCPGQMIISLKQ
ncbi:TPA: hypothetical protein QCI16_004964, partial [Enterobacter ludwigii]|nr:hypothetical protein [Enterobacter ludwigii]